MKAELKVKWLKELRGTRFTQYRGAIGKGTELCCIGVCGAAAGLDQNVDWLTENVSKKIGISSAKRQKLVELNDLEKKSFAEIADWIEINIPAEV